jgi:hypothetical protein
MINSHLSTGTIWRLLRSKQKLAHLHVTESDSPWMYTSVEALPGFEEFLPPFADQERAADADDWERADECQLAIRSALTMTFPNGNPGRTTSSSLGDNCARCGHSPTDARGSRPTRSRASTALPPPGLGASGREGQG